MKVLAIDAATEACSVALRVSGQVLEKYQIAPRQHTQLLLKDIDQVLNEMGVAARDLDMVAYGCGPGAFTGVRLTLSVSQAFAFAHDLHMVPINNLEAVAWQVDAPVGDRVFVAFDARMGQVYFAGYQRQAQKMDCLVAADVAEPDKVPEFAGSGDCWLAGSGFTRYAPGLADTVCATATVTPIEFPRASAIAELAELRVSQGQSALAPDQATVTYVRNKVANKPGSGGSSG